MEMNEIFVYTKSFQKIIIIIKLSHVKYLKQYNSKTP